MRGNAMRRYLEARARIHDPYRFEPRAISEREPLTHDLKDTKTVYARCRIEGTDDRLHLGGEQ